MIFRQIESRQKRRHGKLAWCVHVPKDLLTPGTIKCRYFGDDKKAADAYAKQLTDSRKCVGGGSSEFMKLNDKEQAAVITGLHNCGGVDNLLKAIAHWLAIKPTTTMSVQAVVDECIEAKRKACRREHYLATLRCSLDNFARSVPKMLHEVTSRDVENWMNGNGWQPKTRLGYMKDVSTLFKYAIGRGIVRSNPTDAIERPTLDQKPIQCFSIEDCSKFLNAVKLTDPAFAGYLAPILFGGLRPEESGGRNGRQGLTAANFRNGVIDLSGAQAKLRQRRVVEIDGLLAKWLALPLPAPLQGPAVSFPQVNIVRRRRRLAIIAGVTWSPDVLRHTFCSYSMQKYGATATATHAGHTEQVLFAHYRQVVTKADAEAFFNLTPDSVSGKLNPAPKQRKWKKKKV